MLNGCNGSPEMVSECRSGVMLGCKEPAPSVYSDGISAARGRMHAFKGFAQRFEVEYTYAQFEYRSGPVESKKARWVTIPQGPKVTTFNMRLVRNIRVK